MQCAACSVSRVARRGRALLAPCVLSGASTCVMAAPRRPGPLAEHRRRRSGQLQRRSHRELSVPRRRRFAPAPHTHSHPRSQLPCPRSAARAAYSCGAQRGQGKLLTVAARVADVIAIKSGWDCKGIEFGVPTKDVVVRNVTAVYSEAAGAPPSCRSVCHHRCHPVPPCAALCCPVLPACQSSRSLGGGGLQGARLGRRCPAGCPTSP